MSSACRRLLVAAVSIGLLNACNSGTMTAGIDGSGVRAPIVTQGPIQGFGSIVVNGRHYTLTNAQISVDGRVASEMDLAVGQLVTVSGSTDSNGGDGRADTVQFDVNVQGPVEAVDSTAGTLRVLGQPVLIDTDTVLDLGTAGTGLSALAQGDFVRVSGLVAPSGGIRATWIARGDSSSDLRVIGAVSDVDTANFLFDLNDLTVDYGSVNVLEGFAGGAPSNGDHVRVTATTRGPDGRLLATELERLSRELGEREGDGAEIEGLITRFVSPTDFDVAGLPVTTTSSTVYEGGDVTSLQLDVKVQVEGSIDTGSVIVASKIEVKDGGETHDDD
jgi:hypothetical protein